MIFRHSLWHARVHACPTASGSCDVVRIDCCRQSGRAGGGIDKEKEEKETERVAPLLKSREPDLAGGEKWEYKWTGESTNGWINGEQAVETAIDHCHYILQLVFGNVMLFYNTRTTRLIAKG